MTNVFSSQIAKLTFLWNTWDLHVLSKIRGEFYKHVPYIYKTNILSLFEDGVSVRTALNKGLTKLRILLSSK